MATQKRRWFRFFGGMIAAVLLLPAALTLFFAVVPVPITPLMLIRSFEGHGIRKTWTPIESISTDLQRSVVAAEDMAFCQHFGFDTAALEKAWESYERGGKLRGGSTITMQTAKNLFLWPDRTFIRKGLEAWLTVYIETLWSKPRTLEVYLNIAEWGPGVYGAEAAAQHHFGKSAAALSAHESALLASVLPSPQRWSASKPGPYVRTRAETIEYRAARLGEYGACLPQKNSKR
ncbi:MAG: monofunctional biosynthetic peptidoglycan transglycosylase [Rhodospirillaceae bacterium]|nr:monofunctional biosynthetic peptidoglycan transglycosylase [Rhodospirillaceae bacterium]